MSANKTRFIRVRGRIIPIRGKKEGLNKKFQRGALAVTGIGSAGVAIGSSMNMTMGLFGKHEAIQQTKMGTKLAILSATKYGGFNYKFFKNFARGAAQHVNTGSKLVKRSALGMVAGTLGLAWASREAQKLNNPNKKPQMHYKNLAVIGGMAAGGLAYNKFLDHSISKFVGKFKPGGIIKSGIKFIK